jgi:hypothetical protein
MSLFRFAFAVVTLSLAACAHTSDTSSDRGEAKLATLLEGRTAGTPQSCIAAFRDSRLSVIDGTAVVYDEGDAIWVARPSNPQSLRSNDILIVERTSSQLCKQDIVRTVDRTGGFPTGVVFLGDFVPYRKASN